MPQPTSSHAKGKVEELWQRYLPCSVQRAVQNALSLRAPPCLGPVTKGHPLKPRGLPVCFPPKKSDAAKREVSGSQVQGCPQAKGEFHNNICPLGTFLSTHWQPDSSDHAPWGCWGAASWEVSVVLEQYGWSQFLLSRQWRSFRHQRKCPRKDMARLWPRLLSSPCSHYLWLSCFPATLPAGMMPVCYGDTFTSASSVKSLLLLIGLFPPHLVCDNASILLTKVRWREGGTSCLLEMHKHKAAAAIAASKGIKAVISLPVHSPHPETKPLQSPAGNRPSQRHLHGTSLQGG